MGEQFVGIGSALFAKRKGCKMRYIALLRAVNVGGQHKIKMTDLRDTLESIGLQQVQTYIQSGNILFESNAAESALQTQISNSIEDRFGFPVDVILRTSTELANLVENSPFLELGESGETASGPAKIHVALLNEPPGQGSTERLERYANEQEQYRMVGRDVYLYLNQGMGHSQLAPQVHKLGVPATVRNWKTLTKLHSLAHDTSSSDG